MQSWIIPTLGARKAASLGPRDIEQLVEVLRSQGLSVRSQQLTVGVLKSACRWGTNTGRLARNPIADVRRPKTTDSAPAEVWDADKSRASLDTTRFDRHGWLWALLLTRGRGGARPAACNGRTWI